MNYFEKTLNHLRLFGDRHAFGLALPTKDNARLWLERIENELSPENLTCDGELRGAPLRAKERELLAAQKHCQALLGLTGANRFADQFSVDEGAKDGMPFIRAFNRGYRRATTTRRTHERMDKLNAAVQAGFVVGARVRLSNGLTGKITKINRTRVKVMTDTRGLWNVPPRCMTLWNAPAKSMGKKR